MCVSISLGHATKTEASESISETMRKAEGRMYSNKMLEGRSTSSSVIMSLKERMDSRESQTDDHVTRLKDMTSLMGKALGLSQSVAEELSLLTPIHDIGKVSIPESVLTKPSSLSEDEWELVRQYPEVGRRIACSSTELSRVSSAILSLRERWDGTGYPRGLKGDEIPLISRILAIVDAYDVMTHDRPYRRAMAEDQALAELQKCAGTQFDPDLVSVFVRLIKRQPRTGRPAVS